MTLMLTINIASIAIAFAENDSANEPQGDAKMPEVPGLPENVVQYNKTDVVPVNQKEKVQSNEPALFAYQNTTMLFNSTMNCDLVITAEATANQKIFGLSMDPNQTMTLTMNFSSSPLQSEQDREKNLNFYASIEPNATVELTAQLRLFINQTELNQELNWEVTPEKLTWMYWNGTQSEWVKVPSTIDQDGYLVCNTDHFSLWTVGEIADTTEQTDDVTDMTLIYCGIGAAVVAVLAVAIIVYSKRK
ncbi:hypothetical protein MUO66_02515 [Candidatus Bathyarchaeota archaeon]|nr:hypothetical protein [Candidatus Bathyarchaeota archaeon]